MNRLYFGDNLQWLSDRKEFPDESVDLVYLDPPFNSNADYNVLFRNEIVWKRSSSHADIKQGMRRCGRIHDVLLLYAKSDTAIWNPVFTPYDEDYVESMYRFVDDQGRRYREGDLTAARPGGDVSF